MDKSWAVTDIDFGEFNAAKRYIDVALQKRLEELVKGRSPYATKARNLLADPQKTSEVASALATNAMIYKAGVNPATYGTQRTARLTKRPPQKGRPCKTEIKVLLYDVRETLSEIFGSELGIYQNDGAMAEGIVTIVARDAAASVGKPLTGHLRTAILKSRQIKKFGW